MCSVLCVVGAAGNAYAQAAPAPAVNAAARQAPSLEAPAWGDIKARFLATNPTLQAGRIGIDESKAAEVSAFLRPNPQLSLTLDQIDRNDDGKPLADANPTSVAAICTNAKASASCGGTAQGATTIAVSVIYFKLIGTF